MITSTFRVDQMIAMIIPDNANQGLGPCKTAASLGDDDDDDDDDAVGAGIIERAVLADVTKSVRGAAEAEDEEVLPDVALELAESAVNRTVYVGVQSAVLGVAEKVAVAVALEQVESTAEVTSANEGQSMFLD